MKIAHAKDSKPPKGQPQTPESAPTQQVPAETPAESTPPASEPRVADPVPDGTTAEVLAWVGEDKTKAQAALDKENADDSPRKGLTSELEQILGK